MEYTLTTCPISRGHLKFLRRHWYNDQSHRRNHIFKTDAHHLYLAYHEGHGGYARGSYRGKSGLKGVRAALWRKPPGMTVN